jgi:hypothetical protein
MKLFEYTRLVLIPAPLNIITFATFSPYFDITKRVYCINKTYYCRDSFLSSIMG